MRGETCGGNCTVSGWGSPLCCFPKQIRTTKRVKFKSEIVESQKGWIGTGTKLRYGENLHAITYVLFVLFFL